VLRLWLNLARHDFDFAAAVRTARTARTAPHAPPAAPAPTRGHAAQTLARVPGLVGELVGRADPRRAWGHPEVALALLRVLLANAPAALPPFLAERGALRVLLRAVRAGAPAAAADALAVVELLACGADARVHARLLSERALLDTLYPPPHSY
jgi:hypothetical protein